jgi:hypothetical protein
MPPSV